LIGNYVGGGLVIRIVLRCDHEAPKADEVISENEVGGKDDEIEADCEKHRRRQDLPELFDYECEKTRLGHERIPTHPRQDVRAQLKLTIPTPKVLRHSLGRQFVFSKELK